MALYVIHQDLIEKSKNLEISCKGSNVLPLAAEITKMLILLKENNTFWSITKNRKSLIKQGKEAVDTFNTITVNEDNVQDVMKLYKFFADVASMFGSDQDRYKDSIFEQETITILTKTANLKEIALSFQDALENKIIDYKKENARLVSIDKTINEEKIFLPLPLPRPSDTNNTEKLKVETLPLQNKVSIPDDEIEYYISPKSNKRKLIPDRIKNKALEVFGSLSELITNINNNVQISPKRKTKSSGMTSNSKDNLTQLVSKKPKPSSRKKNSLTRESRSNTASVSSSTENSRTTISESSSQEKVSLALPPLSDAPLNPVNESESLQIQQMREIKENLIAVKKSAHEKVINTFKAQTSDNNLDAVVKDDCNNISFKKNPNLGFFANQSHEDSSKLDSQPVYEANKSSSSDNEFSGLEICILAGLSFTIIGLILVIPYVIYKLCCLDLNVEEPEPTGPSMFNS
ncbi:MAG: hypothetical protein H0T84_00910 [Tatlockia sp.]|nr:hypothetical protein [Tatlockia sp.]